MDFTFDTPSLLWLAATVALLVIEGLTVNLVTIWFAIGAAAALLASLVGGNLLVQVAAFTIVSCAALLLTKPLVARARRQPTIPTNADRNIGRTATVLSEIAPALPGRVTLDGVDWTARTDGSDTLPKGSLCRVTAIDSTMLVVAALPVQAPQPATSH